LKKYYPKGKGELKMIRKDKFIDLGDIYLRSLRQEDLSGNWYIWLNDPVVTRYQDKGIIPNTLEKQQSYYESLVKSSSDIVFAIVFNPTDTHIGNIGLHKIDFIHRHADVGIILGEKDYWNKGFATQSIQAITKYSVNTLNLHRLTAYVMKENTGSLKAFTNAGFVQEGCLKEYYYKNGLYLDVYVMGYTK
jgi:RimJ/RimL family protein N-acetyltransferase